MPYKLTGLAPMLETTNMQATLSFYTTKLGFVIGGSFAPDGDTPIWASLTNGAVEIMFTTPNTVMNYGQVLLTGNLYILTTDIDELWLLLKDNTEIVYPIEDFTYGMREFAIKDNNGYVLSFAMDISE